VELLHPVEAGTLLRIVCSGAGSFSSDVVGIKQHAAGRFEWPSDVKQKRVIPMDE